MLAVVVAVHVQLLVPEFRVTHLLPSYSPSLCVGSEKFRDRNQSIGCALTWVTIARDSVSDYPFNPAGQFRRICAGHLFSPFLQLGRLCDNCFLNYSSVFTEGCVWTNEGHPVFILKSILIDSNLPVTCWHPWSLIIVLTAPNTNNYDLIWGNHRDEVKLTMNHIKKENFFSKTLQRLQI